MLYSYKCGHTQYIEGGIFGTGFLNYECDDCKRNNRRKLVNKRTTKE